MEFYNIPVTIVCTKVDKVSKNNHNKNKQIIMKELNIQDEKDIILFSSITKTGKNEVYDEIEKYGQFDVWSKFMIDYMVDNEL